MARTKLVGMIALFGCGLAVMGCEEKKKVSPAPSASASKAKAKAPTPPEGSVRFAWPQDGSTVFEDVSCAMAVTGLKVSPAGKDIQDRTKGHFHILIDDGPVPIGRPVPKDKTHIHYGKGQTVGDLKLSPGKHKLTLQFADGAHLSYGKTLASTINVTVVKNPEKKPRVFFPDLKDGATLAAKSKIKFSVEGFKLMAAGKDVLGKTSGHHHLIIDGKPIPLGTSVPKNKTHLHFGKAQTEADVELAKGDHTLTLQLADGAHFSYGPKLSATIKVKVK